MNMWFQPVDKPDFQNVRMREGGEAVAGDGNMHMHTAQNNHRDEWQASLFAALETGKTWSTHTIP
jgi:hypothetical protein